MLSTRLQEAGCLHRWNVQSIWHAGCVDLLGAWSFLNGLSPQNTNVVEIYSNMHKDANQLTYYDSGIGTAARPSWISPGTALKRWVDTKLDLVLALCVFPNCLAVVGLTGCSGYRNIEKIILRAYTWLSNHYTEDDTQADHIYLFGRQTKLFLCRHSHTY
jgi:hypothetical protein